MGVSFGNNLSQSDKDRVKGIRNPSATDAGDVFSSGGSGDDPFGDNMFDDLSDLMGEPSSGGSDGGASPFGDSCAFGSQSSGTFSGQGAGGFGGQGASVFGGQSNGAFGGQTNGFGPAFGNGLSGYSQQQQMQRKSDNFDKALNYSGEAFVSIGAIIVEIAKSIKNRTADDIGYYSTSLIKTGLIGLAVSVILCIIAALTHLGFLGIGGITSQFLLAFALTAGFGMGGLGLAAMWIARADADSLANLDSLSDVSSEISGDATSDYEDNIGDIMDDLFGDEPEEEEFTLDINDIPETVSEEEPPAVPNFGTNQPKPVNFDQALSEVKVNSVTNRKNLLETFINFLPLCTPDFYVKREITPDSDMFNEIETAALKAMSNILKCDLEEVNSSMECAYETYFSYEFKMKRVRGLNKIADLAAELEIYSRGSASDTAVTASVVIEGDFYHCIVTKGETAIITLGDALKQQKVYDFFANEKNKLPVISGIDSLGNVVLDDAKIFDTMLIAGKPRSGKSWYLLGIMISMMLFNSPEDVQFIVVDPKESNLFKTLALMPHVAGLHTESDILEVMDDIINNEAKRRKRLLDENRCDSIWDLKKKGVKIPILYLVIDEYITVLASCKDRGVDKELSAKLQVLISQLPSQGIRLIFIPHRAMGIVDKTNRTMIQFSASVKGDIDEVVDTLGIKKWDRPLVNPGDVALKSSSMKEALYVRGVALGTSDEENSELIENIAKAYYKMGVDLPDMSTMRIAVNRDESYIQSILGNKNRVQYDANHIFDDL